MGKGWAKRYSNGDIKLSKCKGWWVADFTYENKRKRTKLIDLERPEKEARAALDHFAKMRHAVVSQQSKSHTIAELWSLWLKDREKDGLDNSIYKANWVSLEKFFGTRTPELLNRDDCREYARQRLAMGRAAGTIHTELVRLRACLSWAYKDNIITKPIHVWSPSASKARNVVLTVEEAKRLLKASLHSDPHIRLFIVLLFSTGGRHRAILDLTWDRVNFAQNYIDLDDKIEINPMHRRRRKGRARVWMSPDARKELELAYSGRLSKYVIEHGGQKLKSCREGFANAVRRAGLNQRITPHTIRHTLATWLFNGIETRFTSKLLGHKNLKTTEIYQHPDHTSTRLAVEEIEKSLSLSDKLVS